MDELESLESRPRDEMSLDELKRLKDMRFCAALGSGLLGRISGVARCLGSDPAGAGGVSRYGPKYRWWVDDIEVFVDDYGGYMTVYEGGRKVCETHATNRFIIPGDWIEKILAHMEEAEQKRRDRYAIEVAAERAELLARL